MRWSADGRLLDDVVHIDVVDPLQVVGSLLRGGVTPPVQQEWLGFDSADVPRLRIVPRAYPDSDLLLARKTNEGPHYDFQTRRPGRDYSSGAAVICDLPQGMSSIKAEFEDHSVECVVSHVERVAQPARTCRDPLGRAEIR